MQSARSEGVGGRPTGVDTWQSAKLYRALCAMKLGRRPGHRHIDLVLDNVGAAAQVLWGRASTRLVAQQHIVRHVSYRLRWQGGSLQLRYVQSELNPANSVNRRASGRGACHVAVEVDARAELYRKRPRRLWCTARDKGKWLRGWEGLLVGG